MNHLSLGFMILSLSMKLQLFGHYLTLNYDMPLLVSILFLIFIFTDNFCELLYHENKKTVVFQQVRRKVNICDTNIFFIHNPSLISTI